MIDMPVRFIIGALERLAGDPVFADQRIAKDILARIEKIAKEEVMPLMEEFTKVRRASRQPGEIKSSTCAYAETTKDAYNKNRSCAGRKILCHHPEAPEGHFSSMSRCRPERCKMFSSEKPNEFPRTF